VNVDTIPYLIPQLHIQQGDWDIPAIKVERQEGKGGIMLLNGEFSSLIEL
jgi:hypothetical protein